MYLDCDGSDDKTSRKLILIKGSHWPTAMLQLSRRSSDVDDLQQSRNSISFLLIRPCWTAFSLQTIYSSHCTSFDNGDDDAFELPRPCWYRKFASVLVSFVRRWAPDTIISASLEREMKWMHLTLIAGETIIMKFHGLNEDLPSIFSSTVWSIDGRMSWM